MVSRDAGERSADDRRGETPLTFSERIGQLDAKDHAPLYRLMDSPPALEAALRLHWEATRAQRPEPPDSSA